MMGDDTALWAGSMRLFSTGLAAGERRRHVSMASTRDYAAVRRVLETADYQGEKLVLMVQADVPVTKAVSRCHGRTC